MRNSIFDIELRIDINTEYRNLKAALLETNSFYFEDHWMSLYKIFNEKIIPVWKYKGPFMDFDDFLYKLNIDLNSSSISEEKFLYLLELIINIWPLVLEKLNFNLRSSFSSRVIGYMNQSIPYILEKMNYKILTNNDKSVIVKRDSDVDSILNELDKDTSTLLLEYNDIRKQDKSNKERILKKLDMFIESNKKDYQSLDNDTYNSIQLIVNKMGINHPINDYPYNEMSNNEIIEWYDKCFKLIIHLIRQKIVKDINKERINISKIMYLKIFLFLLLYIAYFIIYRTLYLLLLLYQ